MSLEHQENSNILDEGTSFKDHIFYTDAMENKYTFRVLKMLNSTLIHICSDENEILSEMAVAMPSRNDIVASTILGAMSEYGNSKELAAKLSKKLNKQIFVSCNIPINNIVRLQLEKRLMEEIKSNAEFF